MPVYAVTGKTGQGKGLVSMGLVQDYLSQGKLVATNMDIFPEHFRDKQNAKTRIIRLPDYPTVDDLVAIGHGAGPDVTDEDDFGLLILDEGATWFNSREWNAPGRKEFNAWLVQRRKYKWNVAVQIQDIESMDSQARRAVISHELRAVKVEAIYIPFISIIIKQLTGKRMPKLPKPMRYHKATLTNLESGLREDVLRYRGIDMHKLYDTLQVYSKDYPHGPHSLLTPWHLVGRYQGPQPSFWGELVRFPLQLIAILTWAICLPFSTTCQKYQEAKKNL